MNKTGKLFIVGTPIGNLNDITLRALETLKSVSYIACEDKRVNIKLLNHFDIKDKNLISYHNFNEQVSANKIIKLLREGHDVALVSDAGMPVIADPGFLIINKVKEEELPWEIIPGVSALTTTITVSGLGPEFTFLGFGKPKKGQLITQLSKLSPGTYVFFVAPHKLEYFLLAIKETHPDDHYLFLAKELTKIYQNFFSGKVDEILEQLSGNFKGEFTLVLKINEKEKKEKINKYKKEIIE